MNCVLPLLLLILAPDPCAVLAEVRAELEKVRQTEIRRVDTHGGEFKWDLALEDLLPLTIIEESNAFPCAIGTCAGTFSSGFGGMPTLRFSRAHEVAQYGVLYHELYHAYVYRLLPGANWRIWGHGTVDDPLRLMIEQWRDWIYGTQLYSYAPQIGLGMRFVEVLE